MFLQPFMTFICTLSKWKEWRFYLSEIKFNKLFTRRGKYTQMSEETVHADCVALNNFCTCSVTTIILLLIIWYSTTHH